jgi:hypothetical protein
MALPEEVALAGGLEAPLDRQRRREAGFQPGEERRIRRDTLDGIDRTVLEIAQID